MGKDTTIGVPCCESAETRDADNTTVSVHFPSQIGWREQRLAPGEAMDIDLPDGTTIAVIEVDEE